MTEKDEKIRKATKQDCVCGSVVCTCLCNDCHYQLNWCICANTHIIQIIPADHWYVDYVFEDENGNNPEILAMPLMGFGLQKDGDIVALTCSSDGYVDSVQINEKGEKIYRKYPSKKNKKEISFGRKKT